MQLITGELRSTVLRRTIAQFDIQGRQLWLGRSLIAFASLSTILLTPYSALMQTVLGRADAPGCAGIRTVSAYCALGATPSWVPTSILAAVFILVIAGVAPILLGWLHAWAAFSIASSIALPDGGDQAAVVFLVLIALVCVGDTRRTAFEPARAAAMWRRQVALGALMALRIQVAMIYFDSAIGKVFSTDWVTGTTEFYVLRDPYFGAWGPIAAITHALTENAIVTVSMTWGAMLLEVFIAVLVLCGPRARIVALLGCIALHGFIIVTIGLWSFGLIMIGGVMVATLPTTPLERRKSWPRRLPRRFAMAGAQRMSPPPRPLPPAETTNPVRAQRQT